MREWVCFILTNYPFKIFVENNEAITKILAGAYSSDRITLTNVITETIIGRDLYLVKWNEDYCDFQGIMTINIINIMITSPIKSQSDFSNMLDEVSQSKNKKMKIKQL